MPSLPEPAPHAQAPTLTERQRAELERAMHDWMRNGGTFLKVISPIVARMIADERERIAQEIEDELVCPCVANTPEDSTAVRWLQHNFCRGANLAARIARGGDHRG